MKNFIITILSAFVLTFTMQAQIIAETTLSTPTKGKKVMNANASLENSTIGNYVQEHFVYPTQAKENGISGKAVISVLVDKDGSASLYRIKGIASSSITAALKSIVSDMPNFQPAIKNGKLIKQVITFNMDLQLN